MPRLVFSTFANSDNVWTRILCKRWIFRLMHRIKCVLFLVAKANSANPTTSSSLFRGKKSLSLLISFPSVWCPLRTIIECVVHMMQKHKLWQIQTFTKLYLLRNKPSARAVNPPHCTHLTDTDKCPDINNQSTPCPSTNSTNSWYGHYARN